MDEAKEMIRKNKEIAEKFTQIEASLSLFLEPADLLEQLMMRLHQEFAIPFVWLSVIDRNDLDSLIQSLTFSTTISNRLNVIDETSLLELLSDGVAPVLVNQELQPFYRLFPVNKKYFIKSIAIAPILLDGRVIGSINCGDADRTRYEPGMDTSLLRHLMETVSAHLETLMKRKFGSAAR